jgi:hypothetical protein
VHIYVKVIFLDFDGVLNNYGSFLYEARRRKKWKLQGIKGNVNETFDNVCASNLQYILDTYPEVKIVVSSTWRLLFSVEELKAKFAEYHIDDTRIIGCTPEDKLRASRGIEIKSYLENHPEIKQYVIIDDNDWDISPHHPPETIVKTSWEYGGLTFGHAQEVVEKLKTPKKERK